jgi:predicted nucleic acid-binding protein
MADFSCLDTNAALRLQLKDVPEQHHRISKMVANSDRKFVIPDIVFFEINFTLDRGYKFSRAEIKDFIERLIGLPNIVCNDEMIRSTLEIFVKFPKLSFADCYLTEFAHAKQGGQLWTFDKKLVRQSDVANEIK